MKALHSSRIFGLQSLVKIPCTCAFDKTFNAFLLPISTWILRSNQRVCERSKGVRVVCSIKSKLNLLAQRLKRLRAASLRWDAMLCLLCGLISGYSNTLRSVISISRLAPGSAFNRQEGWECDWREGCGTKEAERLMSYESRTAELLFHYKYWMKCGCNLYCSMTWDLTVFTVHD